MLSKIIVKKKKLKIFFTIIKSKAGNTGKKRLFKCTIFAHVKIMFSLIKY